MGNKATLFSDHQNGGMFRIGDGIGDVLFVHSGTGTDDTGYGHNPWSPLATLDYAVGLCTAGNGDTIYLLPGHAESIASASALTIDVAGVQVIGKGKGGMIPTFTLGTATTATINVTAANVVLENIKVVSDLADVAAGITASANADNLTISQCNFSDGAIDKELVIGVSIAAGCNGCTIESSRFYTVSGGGCASAIKLVGASDKSRIEGCSIHGDYSVAAIDGATAASFAIDICRNRISNEDVTAGLTVSLHASTTGSVTDNRIFGGKDTVAVVAAGCLVAENYLSNALGASGILKPAADS